MTEFTVAVACNSNAILDANLLRSPMIAGGDVPCHVEVGAPSASIAYNHALDATTAPIVIFAHQDVYFPLGWERLLRQRIAEIAAIDPNWALIGAFGVGLDASHIGPVWSSSLGMIVGRVPIAPVKVQSFDEMVIILRRDSRVRFDGALAGWHLYGTDIVTTARQMGLNAYAGALPCIHNDQFHPALDGNFQSCYRAMQRKWAKVLPLRSPIVKVSRSGLHLYRALYHTRISAGFRVEMAVETATSPEDFARRCGWADLRPCATG